MDNPVLQWSGIDTLKLGLGITWTDLANHALVINQLHQMRDMARKNRPNEWDLMSMPRAVTMPYGRKKYKYSLGNGGTTLFFTDEPKPEQNTPNVMMELQPIYCTRRSLEHLHFHLHCIIDELGAKVTWIRPSELHLTADISTDRDMHITDFYDHNHKPKFTTRGRTNNRIDGPAAELEKDTHEIIIKGMRLEYVRIGSSELMLRIYNKTQELKVHPEKCWEAQAWNDPAHPHVTRVEFQIRREKLKQFSINSLHDIETEANGTWSYLTRGWFQLHNRPHTCGNTEPPNTFWETAINARPGTPPNKPLKKIVPNVLARIHQGLGNLVSAYAIAEQTKPDWWTEEEAMIQMLNAWKKHSATGTSGLWPAIEKRRAKLTQTMRNQINADNELEAQQQIANPLYSYQGDMQPIQHENPRNLDTTKTENS